MEKSLKLSFRKGDWIAVALVVILGIATILMFSLKTTDTSAAVVQIFQNSQLIKEYPLQTEETFSVDGTYHNLVQIANGKAAIVESNCPGTDCVHSGWISQAGRSVVCLPNKVEVRIVGASNRVDENEVDIIVR